MKRLYPWAMVAMLWFVCFINYADRQAIFSLFPLLKHDLALSDIQLGIVGSCFMWMYALAGPLAGWVSDRISPRSVVLGALVFWSMATAATALCHDYAWLVAVRTLGGLGEAFYFPAAMALIGAVHPAATRSRAMAVHQSSVYAGTIGGGAMAALVAERHGWRLSFVSFGAIGVVLALALLFALRPTTVPGSKAKLRDFGNGVLSVLSEGRVVAMIVAFIGANFVAVVFLTWLPTYLYKAFHLSLTGAGFSSTAYLQTASVLGVLCGGVLADRFARRSPGGRQWVQAGGLLLGVPFLVLIGLSPTMIWLIAGMTGFGFCKGLYDANIWASLYDVIPVEKRGVAAGVMNSLGWLGGGFAPIVVAALARHFGLAACLGATSVVYLGTALLLALLARNMRVRGPVMLHAA
ncbi:MAG TPA: MFS transporter [Acidobacteriaceae bacterium]